MSIHDVDGLIAKAWALGDQEKQAQFLNDAGYALFMICRGKNGMETQCCWIVDHLDENGKRLVTELAEFLRVKAESEEKR